MSRTALASLPEPFPGEAPREAPAAPAPAAASAEALAEVAAELRALADDSALATRAARIRMQELLTEVAAVSATVGAQEVNLGQLSRGHQATLALLNEVYDAVRSLARDVALVGRRLDVHAGDPAAHGGPGRDGDLRAAA